MVVAPGARIEVRDAEWLVRRVDRTETGGQALHVVGMSELVKDKEAIFLTDAEREITVLDPADTKLVLDPSTAFTQSRLYVESLLRKTPPTDNRLYAGHRAAMDRLPFQLEPAAHALEQPRQRILIADAVGLGKTITCGILLSELIRRGKGKRILVVAIKSLLTQFQKEMWSRFTIPLTRLDSIGLQRVRNRIPTNHNPFHYFDRAIISVDTLKQENEYRVHLENAYWDIIVIDEAHNVAVRGESASQRAKLAKLLAGRSDSLVLLTATPHDGRAKSFASLMNMLDPTAIADPENYGPDDIRGLFIRRFKKDIQSQVKGSFAEREIRTLPVTASPEEEAAYDTLTSMRFHKLDRHKGGARLFRTTLEKALFSSPWACLETIENRIRRLEKDHGEDHPDIPELKALAQEVGTITPTAFAKFQKLVKTLTNKKSPLFWNGKETTDRLVIFTERVRTLIFLKDHLTKALKLKPKQVETLVGTDNDQHQQAVVETFGKEASPVRLLIATDVAAEGINLHYLSHRMIHFDIPWSLMVFQQRNGRIDRYGQHHTPQISYLTTQSENEKIRGDQRILELLIQKDEEAHKNIGDPSVFFGVYDEAQEEEVTARAMESGQSAEAFEATLEQNRQEADAGLFAEGFDPMALLPGGEAHGEAPVKAAVQTAGMPSLFVDDFHYATKALSFVGQNGVSSEVDTDQRLIELDAPDDLLYRFRLLPREIRPKEGRFTLTDRTELIQREIAAARKEEHTWPDIGYLWELHPVMEWLSDKVVSGFRRHEAPVIQLTAGLAPQESVYLLSGLIPNRKGHPLIQHWFGVTMQREQNALGEEAYAFKGIRDLDEILAATGFGKKELPNPQANIDSMALEKNLPRVVDRAKAEMKARQEAFVETMAPKLDSHLDRLIELQDRHTRHVQLTFENATAERRDQKLREVETTFDSYADWVKETLETEEAPYIKVVAVLTRP